MTYLVDGKTAELFRNPDASAPLILLNAFPEEGKAIWEGGLSLPPFSLLCISGFSWSDDLSPWKAPGLRKGDLPFQGQAESYLSFLMERLLPKILKDNSLKPTDIGIAGYSLAGLFALYSLFRSDVFSFAVSASGSLWYPGFLNFAKKQKLSSNVKAIYLSLGDKEKKTRNPVMQKVEENTIAFYDLIHQKGISSILEFNKGNHFQMEKERTIRGLDWVLRQVSLRK